MESNYEIAVNNLEKLYRHLEKLNIIHPEDAPILEWSLLYLKDNDRYATKVVRQ